VLFEAYLRRMRIRRAKTLMIGDALTLDAIARRCGFASVHGLSRAFRAEEGMTPSQYRSCGPKAAVRVEGRGSPYVH